MEAENKENEWYRSKDRKEKRKMEEEKMWNKNRSVKQIERRKRRRRWGICVVYVLY